METNQCNAQHFVKLVCPGWGWASLTWASLSWASLTCLAWLAVALELKTVYAAIFWLLNVPQSWPITGSALIFMHLPYLLLRPQLGFCSCLAASSISDLLVWGTVLTTVSGSQTPALFLLLDLDPWDLDPWLSSAPYFSLLELWFILPDCLYQSSNTWEDNAPKHQLQKCHMDNRIH